MTDNSTHTDAVTPQEMAQILARLERGSTPAVSTSGTGTGMEARSVKMPKELDIRVGLRAEQLGMTKSAYFRWLAERDLKDAYSDEPEMVPLTEARAIATRAVDEALAQLSHRPGHAA
ncbi:hypothetical protein [Nocardia yamanashiensis]|uniref:hypothetical protein n=1 Tax=Nocardia yamanashiensis TaxID=209247 RepID=UPI0008338517|nr:hypothetical protein [Nocardia yamanashiensis]